MANRKNILDQNKEKLLDSVNAANQVHTNEELSVLLDEQQKKLSDLETKYDAAITELKNVNALRPVGEYDLFNGNLKITTTTYTLVGATYVLKSRINQKLGTTNPRYRLCISASDNTQGRNGNGTFSYVALQKTITSEIVYEFQTHYWGEQNAASTECSGYIASNLVEEDNYEIIAKTDTNRWLILYRVFLLVYE